MVSGQLLRRLETLLALLAFPAAFLFLDAVFWFEVHTRSPVPHGPYVFLVFVVLLLAVLLLRRFKDLQSLRMIELTGVDYAGLVLGVSIVASLPFAPSLTDSLRTLIFVGGSSIAFYLLGRLVEPKTAILGLVSLLSLVVLCSIITLFLYDFELFGMRFTATYIHQNLEFHALTFLFNEPNGFAIYPALLFPIGLALMLHKCDWKWVMAITILGLAPSFFCIWQSESRGGMLLLLACVATLILIESFKRAKSAQPLKKRRLAAGAAVILILYFMVKATLGYDLIAEIVLFADIRESFAETTGSRWRSAEMLLTELDWQHLLTGYGYGRIADMTRGEYLGNMFIGTLIESGIFSLLALMFFVGCVVQRCLILFKVLSHRSMHLDWTMNFTICVAVSIIVGALAHDLVEYMIPRISFINFAFFFFLGYTTSVGSKHHPTSIVDRPI